MVLAVACAGALGLLVWRRAARSASASGEATPSLSVVLMLEPDTIPVGGAARVTCKTSGGQGRPRFTWQAREGTVHGSDASVEWLAPWQAGRYRVRVLVDDGRDRVESSVIVTVRLPTPAGAWSPATSPRPAHPGAQARLADLRSRIAALLRKDDPYAHDEWRTAMVELGQLLLKIGRHEEAREVYWRLLGDHPIADDTHSRPYRRGYGEAAFFLGREEEALQALLDAGPDNTAESHYYLGWLLERRGRPLEAAEAYEAAIDGMRGYAEPVLRAAQLQARLGNSARAVELLVQASPVLGRTEILDRLGEDPELADLRRALAGSGREDELAAKQSQIVVGPSEQ